MERKIKQKARERRHKRVRGKIFGTAKIPRFCVFRSAKHIYAQLIDDEKGRTLFSVKDAELKTEKVHPVKSPKGGISPKAKLFNRVKKTDIAKEVGKLIAEKAIEKKIDRVVFDRGGFAYHGRVKALAEGAREGGLKF